jgi:hypothetical protein
VFYAPTTSVKYVQHSSPYFYFYFYFSSYPDLALVPEVSFFAHPEDTRVRELFELLNFYPLLIAHPRQEQEHTDSELRWPLKSYPRRDAREPALLPLTEGATGEGEGARARYTRKGGTGSWGSRRMGRGCVARARAARVPILSESHALRNQRKTNSSAGCAPDAALRYIRHDPAGPDWV